MHDVPIDVPANVSAYDCESNNDKDMTKDAIIQLYRTMYQKWIEFAKVNQKLNEHVVQMNVEKREHLKKIAALETELAESKKVLIELNNKLEQMKKSTQLENFQLDQILIVGKGY